MRIDIIIVLAAAIFLGYAYFNDAASVEYLWEKFLRAIALGAIAK